MMSNSNIKNLFTILMSVLLISSCGPLVPTELPVVTSAPTSQVGAASTPERESLTSQPSIVSPTEQISLTPTDPPFVLPGGRLLFSPFKKVAPEDWTCTTTEQ